MKTILVPIDFSDTSFRQLQAVRPFLPDSGADVHVLHVHAAGSEVSPEDHRQLDLHLRNLDALLEGSDVETRGRFLEGPVAKTLLEEAERMDADLLVIGSHGHGATYDALVGSVARRLVAKSTRPLVVVPEGVDRSPETAARFVVAVDFGPHSDVLIKQAAKMAASCGGQVKLLHVVPPPPEAFVTAAANDPALARYESQAREEASVQLGALLDSLSLSIPVQCEVRTGGVPEILLEAGENGDGVLVIGSHGHGRAYDLLLGSITQIVVRKASHPILVLPLHAKVIPEEVES